MRYTVESDAWADSQTGSKLWLCEILEDMHRIGAIKPNPEWHEYNITIYGGWYGVLANYLFVRGRIPINTVRSYDLDPEHTKFANRLNKHWEIDDHKFLAVCADVNEPFDPVYDHVPDIIINTSVEHIEGREWFDRIPSGTVVVLQTTDMDHPDHSVKIASLEQFKEMFPLTEERYSGWMSFAYPDKSFTRWMYIGYK